MEYAAELSEPRYRKTMFYCYKCQAWRYFFNPSANEILALLFDGIKWETVMSPRIAKKVSKRDTLLGLRVKEDMKRKNTIHALQEVNVPLPT